jgi:hypothetical protein
MASLPELAALPPAAKRSGCRPGDAGKPELRPALLARYQDLSRLRYDYPLILTGSDPDNGLVRTLSNVIDGILQEIAPRGEEGERLRKHLLRLEEEVRALASRGARGTLKQLWELAENNLLSRAADDDARKSLGDSLSRTRSALRLDGSVIGCDAETPVRVLTHLWTAVEADKAENFRRKVDRLILKLSDIIKADYMKSGEARTPDGLKRSIGTAFEAAFDFEEMSHLLETAAPNNRLSETRRRRICSALSVLQSQSFFAPAHERDQKEAPDEPHAFIFDSCTRALKAFQDRLPEMIELIKAIVIAELEIENQYKETTHDPLFNRFDQTGLTPDDLVPFPSYLVRLYDGDYDGAEKAVLIEALSSGLPMKVVAQHNDILEELPIAAGRFAFGANPSQLASMAIGLNTAYVLQSSSSYLYQARSQILKGLAYHGPALFSVFSGSSGNASGLPSYLVAAAAMESRAFPAFAYDPAAGEDWASRFHVGDNPQAEAGWPVHGILYEDEDHQSVSQDVAFTFVDFLACDKRYAECFTAIPRSEWHAGMIPLGAFLERDREDTRESVPYVLMVDQDNVLQRFIVDGTLIDATRRCHQMWHSLQELGGINSSHAKRLVERERERWEQGKEQELEELKGRLAPEAEAPAVVAEAVTTEAAVEAEVEEPEEPPSDEPYVETPRCTTCNECTDINNRLFAYDENMQAYIADPDAGTYREIVEAAENCQVCIIHPGKPRNPNEPNLGELIKRAEPFI